MAVPRTDVELAEAGTSSRSALHVFRELIALPELAREKGATRMVKTRITRGDESMLLWLNVDTDTGSGFDASVFEAPPEFPDLKPGLVLFVSDSEVLDWAVIYAGILSGGYSLRVARSRLPEADRAAYDSYIGVNVYTPLPSD